MTDKDLLILKKTIEDDAWFLANTPESDAIDNSMVALGMFRAANIITNFIANKMMEEPMDNTCEPDIEGDDYSLYSIGKKL